MQRKSGSVRNKLMVACALVMAAVLAAPAAMARDRYQHRGNDSADMLGALVVGAVIGGVLVSASQHRDRYYDGGYYYPAQPYPSQGYYGGYPSYGYSGSGYYGYPAYGYGDRVSVGVVYRNHDNSWRGRDSRYYGRSYGYQGRHDYRRQGGWHRGGQGHYYSRHGH